MTPTSTSSTTPPPIVDATRISRSDKQLCTELDGEFVVMHTGTGKFFTLSRTTHAIWRLLETPTRFDALLQALLAAYDVTEATCRAETAAFIHELAAADLVRLEA